MPDGTIVHNRNLDYLDTSMIVTYIGRFMKGDQILFEAVMAAGTNGILTGIRNGSYSLSLN